MKGGIRLKPHSFGNLCETTKQIKSHVVVYMLNVKKFAYFQQNISSIIKF